MSPSLRTRIVPLLAHPWFGAARDAAFIFAATAVTFAVSDGYPPWQVPTLALINTVLFMSWGLAADLYDVSHPRVVSPPWGRLVRTLIWVLLTYLATHFVTEGDPERRTIIFAWGAAVGAVFAGYTVRALALTWFQHRGSLRERLLIVGGGDQGEAVATQIARHQGLSLQLVGALDEFSPRTARLGPIEILGDPLDLEAAVDRTRATAVVVVANAISWEAQEHVIHVAADRPGLRVFMVAGVSDLLSSEVVPARDGMPPLVRLRPAQLKRSDAILKRLMDIGLALLLLPVLGLVLLLSASSGGRPLTRVVTVHGKGGRTVRMRQLTPGTASASNGGRSTLRAHFAAGRAGKLTALGAVIRGDLSLVGPRPMPVDPAAPPPLAASVSTRDPSRRRLLLMAPGLTGPWDDAPESNHELDDLTYIRTYTIWEDLRLLAGSFRRLLRRETPVPALSDIAIPAQPTERNHA